MPEPETTLHSPIDEETNFEVTTPSSETRSPENEEEKTTPAPHTVKETEDSTLLEEETNETIPEQVIVTIPEQVIAEKVAEALPSLSRDHSRNLPPLDFNIPRLRSIYSFEHRRPAGTARSSQCGSRGRIIGGLLASVGEWPWAVAVKDKNGAHYCGGVLVSSRHIVTAAHCIGQ